MARTETELSRSVTRALALDNSTGFHIMDRNGLIIEGYRPGERVVELPDGSRALANGIPFARSNGAAGDRRILTYLKLDPQKLAVVLSSNKS